MGAINWPEDENLIASLIAQEYEIREDIHVRRLARAVRNQISYLERGENGPAGFYRYGTWARELAKKLTDREVKEFLRIFSDIQARLCEKYERE